MVATAKVADLADVPAQPVRLVCNCSLRLSRPTGEQLTVKTRSWDCPSCGLDKRNSIATMVETESARQPRMVTFTFAPLNATGPTPDRHRFCDWRSHVWHDRVYRNGKPTGERKPFATWHMINGCRHCCSKRSRMIAALIKRCRRRWGSVDYLYAVEDHKSGAMHIHAAMVGLPAMSAKSRAGRRLREMWAELGGGRVDVGYAAHENARAVGWYIGKYLAKRHDTKLAKGYRRWSRGYYFARGVTMPRNEPSTDEEDRGPLVVLGWVVPGTDQIASVRTFPAAAAP